MVANSTAINSTVTNPEATTSGTRAWREQVVIPTYGVGAPDPTPMFLEKRVYQGSSGAVYPLPVIDQIDRQATPQAWDAVFLENEFLKIMLLPQLGGRVQMALDKTNDYHFVYYNRVIKPALVGLAGPWISGGIEFNWPQHHRPGTYSPVDCQIENHADGSTTVWMHEIDLMHGTRGTHGLRLRPGRAVLEIDVRLSNRTQLPQTFLWWANPAVAVDEHHQSIFPPDVHAVMDHGKRDVSEFPIARGTYYKVDYSPGTDISRYRNIPVPTSYMAYHSDYNFVGSYDHGRQAGLLHVADHHVSPGKKQWTWGNGKFGQAWDRLLTDEDGPYIELMCGVFTDNQPDFSWLAPGEEKRFTQNFMPYKGVGQVANATTDAAIGYELEGRMLIVRVCGMARFGDARLRIQSDGKTIIEQPVQVTPEKSDEARIELPAGVAALDLSLELLSGDGRVLVSCATRPEKEEPIPSPAKAIEAPEKLASVEALCLAGEHLEQYRHATREPIDYYAEALKREPDSYRGNLDRGKLLLRRGRFDLAESPLRQAVATATRHNPNPATGESYYQLGLCLAWLGNADEAYDAFAKSTWNADHRSAAHFEMARLAIGRQQLAEAERLLNECLVENSRHHQAVHLLVAVNVLANRIEAAKQRIEQELAIDPFNFGVLFERSLLTDDWSDFDERIRGELNSYLELSLDYAAAGLGDRAVLVLDRASKQGVDSPLVGYYQAAFYDRVGQSNEATAARQAAQQAPIERCFPNKLAEIAILQEAAAADPNDARPPYLLGMLWYDRRQADLAIECWEQSSQRDSEFATVWRNLGLAYFNKQHDAQTAWQAYEKAFALQPSDARLLYELDQLAKRLGHPPDERLERLQLHPALVAKRDDLLLEQITLFNRLDQPQQALDTMLSHEFRPWEGGEGKVPAQYVTALLALVRRALASNEPGEAIALINRADDWPESLGEGKLPGPADCELGYYRGVALRKLEKESDAQKAFAQASQGSTEVGNPMFYNDQPPEQVFYQGLAMLALGKANEARDRFERLLQHGQQHADDQIEIDFFAVSLPDFVIFDVDLQQRNQIHCLQVQGLGKLGLGLLESTSLDNANVDFQQVLALSPDHQSAAVHLAACADTRLLGW